MKRLVAIVAVCSVLLLSLTAFGRPGGGQSFSGGSRSGSTSGGSRSFGGSSSSSSGGSRSFSGSSSSSSSGSSRSTRSSSSSSSGDALWSGSTTSSSGSSYTGSSSGSTYSSGSSSSGSSHAFLWFLGLCAVLLLCFWLYGRTQQNRNADWVARGEAEAREEEARRRRWTSIQEALAGLRAADDAFSFVLFEDFLYALYGEAHHARAQANGLETLAAYLSFEARTKLSNISNGAPDAIVIGGMTVNDVVTVFGDPNVHVTVVFTSNISERGPDGRETAYYQEEQWSLRRNLGAVSRPPQRARTVDCPSCGAPRDKTVGGKCGYCGAAPTEGANDWFVADVNVLHREARGPMLTGTTEETGTDLPTVIAPDVRAQLEALQREDPSFTWQAFLGRIERTFASFHRSWSAQDLTEVRPYLSDNLFELQRYWVSAYRQQRLRNVTEGARIVTVHLARVTRDKWFHAITVRVYATGLDYTMDANGAVVGGNRQKTRDYSEYWTFIRGVGTKGAPRSDGNCPSCGAPLTQVNMAGKCGSCGAKVTTGEFDWVLSRIEQDEVYRAAA